MTYMQRSHHGELMMTLLEDLIDRQLFNFVNDFVEIKREIDNFHSIFVWEIILCKALILNEYIFLSHMLFLCYFYLLGPLFWHMIILFDTTMCPPWCLFVTTDLIILLQCVHYFKSDFNRIRKNNIISIFYSWNQILYYFSYIKILNID